MRLAAEHDARFLAGHGERSLVAPSLPDPVEHVSPYPVALCERLPVGFFERDPVEHVSLGLAVLCVPPAAEPVARFLAGRGARSLAALSWPDPVEFAWLDLAEHVSPDPAEHVSPGPAALGEPNPVGPFVPLVRVAELKECFAAAACRSSSVTRYCAQLAVEPCGCCPVELFLPDPVGHDFAAIVVLCAPNPAEPFGTLAVVEPDDRFVA